jgi:hypothetical protein
MSLAQLVSDVFEAVSDQEPMYSVKLVVPALIGKTCREAGETVKVCEIQARALIKNGAAVGSLLSPSTLTFETPREVKPQPAVAPDANPNVKVVSGTEFCGTRNFGPGEQFRYRGDLVKRLALQSAEPGSPMSAYVFQNCTRTMAILEPIGRLGTEDEKRLARLRKDPLEASETQRLAAKRLYELAASL